MNMYRILLNVNVIYSSYGMASIEKIIDVEGITKDDAEININNQFDELGLDFLNPYERGVLESEKQMFETESNKELKTIIEILGISEL